MSVVMINGEERRVLCVIGGAVLVEAGDGLVDGYRLDAVAEILPEDEGRTAPARSAATDRLPADPPDITGAGRDGIRPRLDLRFEE